MARGSVHWRCSAHGIKKEKHCDCSPAKYVAFFRDGRGKQTSKAISRNKKEAERYLNDVINRINDGSYREIRPEIFRNLSKRWLDCMSSRLAASTHKSYRGLIDRHIDPVFGDFQLTQITALDIEAFLSDFIHKKALSARTANYSFTIFKAILTQARKWGFLRENPAEDIKKLKGEKKKIEILRPDQAKRLLQYAQEPYRTLFYASLITGLRKGEITGLQWGDIDWHSNVIYVRRQLKWRTKAEALESKGGSFYYASPKTKHSERQVEMEEELRKALQIHRINARTNPDDLVFCSKVGSPLDPNNVVRQQFNPTLTAAGLPHFSFHSLRHTNASLRILKGEHPKFVQEQLGHGGISTTMDLYGHLFPSSYRKAYKRTWESLHEILFDDSFNPENQACKDSMVSNPPPERTALV